MQDFFDGAQQTEQDAMMNSIDGVASRIEFRKSGIWNFNALGVLNQGITLQVQIWQNKTAQMLLSLRQVNGQCRTATNHTIIFMRLRRDCKYLQPAVNPQLRRFIITTDQTGIFCLYLSKNHWNMQTF